MNKINVNMTPTPIGVPTLHCSQNDKGREFQIKLHNNGEGIDSSEFVEPIIYPVFKGGTEQLLPVNTSTPTTSPILADIQYPDELRTDQYFTYRECPTTEDGYAKSVSIKGNSIGWNQLVQLPTGSTSTVNGVTFTNNNDGSWTVNGTATATAQKALMSSAERVTAISGHKYLTYCGVKDGGSTKWLLQLYKNNANTLVGTETNNNGTVYTADSTTVNLSLYFTVYSGNTINQKIYPQVIDLTLLNDSRVSDYTSFKQYYPLDYYSHNQGTLINFNGDAIKATGKNLLDISSQSSITSRGITWANNGDGTITANGTASGGDSNIAITFTGLSGNLYFSGCADDGSASKWNAYIWEIGVARAKQWDKTTSVVNCVNATQSCQVYCDPNASYNFTLRVMNGVTVNNILFKPMLRFADADSTFEPYTTSTTSLPINQYFPTGMKDSGSAYDELSAKAITRVGAVDLGSLPWTNYGSSYSDLFYSDGLVGLNAHANQDRIYDKCAKYEGIVNRNHAGGKGTATEQPDKTIRTRPSDGRIYIVDSDYDGQTGTAFATSLSGVYLNYELSSYTEVDVTSASLVSEYGEIPLKSEDDYLVGECTSEFSQNPGFHDCKIKLTDADGECYSQKIQLHVEEKP